MQYSSADEIIILRTDKTYVVPFQLYHLQRLASKELFFLIICWIGHQHLNKTAGHKNAMHIAARITSGYRIKFTNSSNHGRGKKEKKTGAPPVISGAL